MCFSQSEEYLIITVSKTDEINDVIVIKIESIENFFLGKPFKRLGVVSLIELEFNFIIAVYINKSAEIIVIT